MESSDNFPISEISLPEPSMMTGKSNMPSQFTALLNSAQQKRREADGKWDTLVDMLINEFSKQASMIARMKMQGQIDSPVAEELLKHIPDQAAGLYVTDLREAELERQDLNQLMSVEMQLSPVGQLRSGSYRTNQMMPNLNQSNQTSHVTPQMSITHLESNGPESEEDDDKLLEESKSIELFDEKLGSSNKQELKLLSQSQSKSKGSIQGSQNYEESNSQSSQEESQSFQGDDSTQFDQVVRVNEDTEQSATDLSSSQIQTSITSSKIEKVSILQPPTESQSKSHEIVINPKKHRKQNKDDDEIPDNEDLLRYNQEMKKNKRKLSLTNQDQNQLELQKEVSFTPMNRDISNNKNKMQQPLIVYDENPTRAPPLTSKPKSSYRQQFEEQMQAKMHNNNDNLEFKSVQTASEFKIQIKATEESQISISHSSISIDAEIQLSKAKKPLGLQPLRLSQVLGKQVNAQAMFGNTTNFGSNKVAPLQSSLLNPFSNPLFMNSNGPISSRTDHRKIVGGLQFQSNDKFGTPSLQDEAGPGLTRRLTLQAQSNFDAKSNLDEFNSKVTGQLAVTSNVSLTESKLILALKKQLDMAKELLEKEHTIKLRLIEGARNLKQQLTVALKENSKVRYSLTQVQSESGNQTVSPFEQIGDNAQKDYSAGEILSPLINIRMKVSSATQTEEANDQQLYRQVSSGGTTIIDADSGGCTFTPEELNSSQSVQEKVPRSPGLVQVHSSFPDSPKSQRKYKRSQAERRAKCDAQAQTEEDLAQQQDNSQYDHQKVELEIQKIIENHEIETARMRGNVDFWKEKVDTLIKSQKEMLESKTKLHLQLEENDQQLQNKLQENKQLVEEIEILQQKVTKQRYLKPQISMQQNQFGSVEEFTPYSKGLTSTAQSADKISIGNGLLSKSKQNYKNQGKSTIKFTSGYNHPKNLRQTQQKFENIQLNIEDDDQEDQDSSFNDTSVVVEIQDKKNAGNFGVGKSTGLGTKIKTQIPDHSSASKMTYTEMANKYENQNNQSPAKQAARRAVIKKGQSVQNIGGSNNKFGVPTPNSIYTNTNYGQLNAMNLATNDRFSSPEMIQPNSATTRQTKYPTHTMLKHGLLGQKVQGKPSLKPRNSSEKDTPNTSTNNVNTNNTSGITTNHQKKNSLPKYSSVRTPNQTQRQPQSQQSQLCDDSNKALSPQKWQSKKPSGLPQSSRPQLAMNKKKQSLMGNNNSSQLFGAKDLTASGQNQSTTNLQQIQPQNSGSSYQATQAKYAPLDKPLTTQDKFSMFTQKHVKQAKKQESDQKAQRDMMVQLIRDRLLQKNTNTNPSANLSTISMNQSRADIQHKKQQKRRNMSQLDSNENQIIQNVGTSYLLQAESNLTPTEDRTPINQTMVDQSMDRNLNLLIQEMNEEDPSLRVNQNPSHNQYIYDTGGSSGATDIRPLQQQHQNSRFQDSNTPEGTSQNSLNHTTETNAQLVASNHEISQNMLMTRTNQYGAVAIQQNSSLGRTQELIQRKTAGSAYSKRANEAMVYQPLNGLSSQRSSNGGQTAGNHSARAKFITQSQQQQAVLMRNTQAIPSVAASLNSTQNQQAIPGRIMSLNSQQNQSITNSSSNNMMINSHEKNKTGSGGNSSSLSHLQFQSRLRAPSKNNSTQQINNQLQSNERFPTPLEQRQMKKRLSTEESELQPSDSDARLKRYF